MEDDKTKLNINILRAIQKAKHELMAQEDKVIFDLLDSLRKKSMSLE